jgi:type II secretory pathway component PulF
MPVYEYKAKQGPGKTVEGTLVAETHSGALEALDRLGYIPVWVREQSPDVGNPKRHRRLWTKVRGRDITLFTGQLASLTRSGVPILRALRTIEEQTENPRMAEVIRDIENRVRDGQMLSEAFSRQQQIFPELFVNMIKAGESGGLLDVILTKLTEAREEAEETRRKVQSAMAYPLLVISVGVITVFVLLTFFLPRVLALFDSYQDLPPVTQLLVAVSGFFEHNWYWLVMLALLTWAVFKRLAALERGKLFVDRLRLGLPLVGSFLCSADLVRFSRTLALLLNAGISLDKALVLAGQTLGNSVLREEVEHASSLTVQQGMPFSIGLKKAEHFPMLMSNMVAVGEQSGKMDEALLEVASFYEKRLTQQSRVATSLLEPILILVVGGLVGFIVIAMLLPIFEMSSTLR